MNPLDAARAALERATDLSRRAPRPSGAGAAGPTSPAAATFAAGDAVYDRVSRQLGQVVSVVPAAATAPATYTVQLASGVHELRVAEQLRAAAPRVEEVTHGTGR